MSDVQISSDLGCYFKSELYVLGKVRDMERAHHFLPDVLRVGRALQDSAAFALQDVIELANGCICCSVKNDLVQALEAMMQRRSKFDYILIETTGACQQHGLECRPSNVRSAALSCTDIRNALQ